MGVWMPSRVTQWSAAGNLSGTTPIAGVFTAVARLENVVAPDIGTPVTVVCCSAPSPSSA